MTLSASVRADSRIDSASLHAVLRLALGRPLAPGFVDWPAALALAEQERLLGVVWKRSAVVIRREAPPEVATTWQRRALSLGLMVERQLGMLAETMDTLEARGVGAVVLKGCPLAQRIYGDITVRPVLDSDVYVPAEHRRAAAEALREIGWRCTAGTAPEEERFERRAGTQTFMLEVHSSALDDPLLDHIHFPVQQRRVLVAGHWLPAHSGRFVPGFIAAHLAKHHEKPLLWALDFYLLWSSLDVDEQQDASAAAREAGLDRHLTWAIETTVNIDACARELSVAEPALRRLRENLTTSGDARRMLRLVSLSDSPAAALQVVAGRVWPAAWRRGWREAPGYFLRRAAHWLYRHLVFERPSAATAGVDDLAISLAAADCQTRLRAASKASVWVTPADGSMEPAIPHFARVRVASRDAISVRRGDVVVACDPYGRCSLRRVTWLGNDHVRIKADARIGGEELVPRAALLGICDLVDVGGEGQSIESRPQGALRVLGAIIRRRRLTVSQTERRMYVYDFGGSRIANVDSPVHFAELTLDEIHERWESLRAGGEAIPFTTGGQNGCVVGTLGGRQVYHAWYLRIDGSRLQAAPNDWRPRGTVLFLHGMYTEPAFRGRGIHTAAFRWLLARDESANTAHAIAVVNEDNVPARRAVEAVGFRFAGRVS